MALIRAFSRSIEPIVYWLCGVSLALLLFKLFVLDEIPAPSPAFFKLGYIAETTLRSLLAGTIFYVTVTATKTYTDRKRLVPWLLKRIKTVVSRHEELLEFLADSVPESVPGDRVAEAFENLVSSDLSPEAIDLKGGRATWRQYLKTYVAGISEICAQMGRRGSFMDSSILRTVTEIEHCNFINIFSTLPDFVTFKFRLSSFYDEFKVYDALVMELKGHQDQLTRDFRVSLDQGKSIPLQRAEDDSDEEQG